MLPRHLGRSTLPNPPLGFRGSVRPHWPPSPRAGYTARHMRALVIHPPVSIARDFIDYPYFADLGAVQLAAVLREVPDVDVALIDSYALAGSSLTWREDQR